MLTVIPTPIQVAPSIKLQGSKNYCVKHNVFPLKVHGLQLKDGRETATALIAHFKIAQVHLALNWQLTAMPSSGELPYQLGLSHAPLFWRDVIDKTQKIVFST